MPRATAKRSRRRLKTAFTLIELLVVVSIIALLVAILLPSLRRAKGLAKVTTCLSNLRAQGAVLNQYVMDYDGSMPPYFYWHLKPEGGSEVFLINEILARYQGEPFERDENTINPTPTGIWRCPNVPVDQDNTERWTHSGILHHAPNYFLFNEIRWYEPFDSLTIGSSAPTGWYQRYGGSDWRLLDRIRRPLDILMIMCNTSYWNVGHGHRESREGLGAGDDVVTDAGEPDLLYSKQRGSHDRLGLRPTVFVDGHGASLPGSPEYWRDTLSNYRPFEIPSFTTQFYHRDVQHFMWFIEPGEYAGPAD